MSRCVYFRKQTVQIIDFWFDSALGVIVRPVPSTWTPSFYTRPSNTAPHLEWHRKKVDFEHRFNNAEVKPQYSGLRQHQIPIKRIISTVRINLFQNETPPVRNSICICRCWECFLLDGFKLKSPESICTKRVLKRARTMMKDTHHPAQHFFMPRLSDRRLKSNRGKTEFLTIAFILKQCSLWMGILNNVNSHWNFK